MKSALLVTLLLVCAVPALAQPSKAGERQCGQHLGRDEFVAAGLLATLCAERDFNQALASCRTCQNLAFAGVMVGFTGLASNINGHNTQDYHTWQFVGQTSASYLLYTINTSRGGLLRWWGLVWVSNSMFQAVVNRAAGLCGSEEDEHGGLCWSNREEATWDLQGVAVPKLWHGGARAGQLSAGLLLIGAGLTVDAVDYFWPNSGRHISTSVGPTSFALTYRF